MRCSKTVPLAPDTPPPPPAEPDHAPVQVITGNCKRMGGVCRWDAIKHTNRPI
jgi:hypothetical protein